MFAAAEKAKEQASAAFDADKSNATAKATLIEARKQFSTLRNRLKKMPKEHEKRRRERNQKYKHPRWVEMCHAVLGKKMLWCTTEFRQWDMYTHAEIILGYLPDVFAPAIGSGRFDFEAKELLERLQQASYGRTLRAHQQQPKEIEVLTALDTMQELLILCGLDDGAAKLSAVLDKAQDLCEQVYIQNIVQDFFLVTQCRDVKNKISCFIFHICRVYHHTHAHTHNIYIYIYTTYRSANELVG